MYFLYLILIECINSKITGHVFQLDIEIFRTMASFIKISSGHSLLIKLNYI